MEAAIVINRGKADRASVEEALRTAGIVGEVELVAGDRIEERVRSHVEGGARLIIVGGGDGSVGAAASALAGSDATLGILPLGTLNHFARDLGIPADLGKAAALIAKGRERAVDVAQVNGRTFVNNSAIGLYPLMVVDRENQQHRLGRSKRLAMLVASFRTLAKFHDDRLTLTSNEGRSSVDTPLLFVGNNEYRVAMPGAGSREALDDGHLCVLVMRKKGVPGFLAATARALIGLAREDDMVRIDDVERLRVDSRRASLTVSIDGETCRMKPPLDYRIRKGALRVRVAAPKEATRRSGSKL
ncbi:MAG TPA: diacylglycerol kinase family protein [Sphingomicrobium sp.]|nr:diacylglycerol kinase family protein [Sphingomicrobium sp.]